MPPTRHFIERKRQAVTGPAISPTKLFSVPSVLVAGIVLGSVAACELSRFCTLTIYDDLAIHLPQTKSGTTLSCPAYIIHIPKFRKSNA